MIFFSFKLFVAVLERTKKKKKRGSLLQQFIQKVIKEVQQEGSQGSRFQDYGLLNESHSYGI